MIHLLDANVLIALADRDHPHHSTAVRFIPLTHKMGWATCPLVENDFIRIIGNPGYRNGPGSCSLARQLLQNLLSAPGHQFWPDDLSLTNTHSFPQLPSHKHLTDHYLLALAGKHGGRFATFDHRIDPSTLPRGREALFLIPHS